MFWVIAISIFLLLNWKSLPFAWHLRVFHAWLKHAPSKSSKPVRIQPPGTVFKPTTTSSRTSLLECDFNLHKSNSTYFADLDISRGALIYAQLSQGVHSRALAKELKGSGVLILGGVVCSFKREIVPLGSYDMESRILTWDRKWIYITTHFVRKGQTSHFDLDSALTPKEGDNKVKPVVYASAVSRYVFKCGRLTIPPEKLLVASGLLASEFDAAVEARGWNWSKVEEERQRRLGSVVDCFGRDGVM
ncbi:hypothetical protein BJ875DRAFT_377166 [Amylocarpus encephaloides]|uniref:Capsule polysaccharide biosynthesis protein n=1 Tax=Amylocarpus encephaloides TaxID=45428 RepID=A0A9P7YI54_9HELO|nr:hypothetical protein BJ875DRAFT_377166 [Amylocarpus encephaloides]